MGLSFSLPADPCRSLRSRQVSAAMSHRHEPQGRRGPRGHRCDVSTQFPDYGIWLPQMMEGRVETEKKTPKQPNINRPPPPPPPQTNKIEKKVNQPINQTNQEQKEAKNTSKYKQKQTNERRNKQINHTNQQAKSNARASPLVDRIK